MVFCSALNCKVVSGPGVSLFRFPPNTQKHKQRRELWIKHSGLTEINDHKEYRLCDRHFEPHQINRLKQIPRLVPGAIPKNVSPQSPPVSMVDYNEIDNIIKHDHPYAKGMRYTKMTRESKVLKCEKEIKALREKLRQKDLQLRKANKRITSLTKKLDNLTTKLYCVFNQDQLDMMAKKYVKKGKWTQETVQKSLQFKFMCGRKGYKFMLKQGFPLPSIRTLQRRIENIKFKPGILNDVFNLMESKVKSMREDEKLCALLLDEMSVKESVEYDSANDQFIGDVSLPGHSGSACKALVFMLRGITTKWKQVVQYEFTGESTSGKVVLNIINKIVEKAHDIGLSVISIGTDMGSNNQAFWKVMGLGCKRSTEPITSVKHSKKPDHKIWFNPDVTHLVKNLRNHFVNGQVLKLPPDMVQKYNLPSDTVDLKYVKMMYDLDVLNKNGLRAAPNLTDKHFCPNQWEKMKVRPAMQLIASKKTASALNYYIEKNKLPNEAQTTAWFINKMDHWCYLMCDKHMGLSLHKNEKYEEAVRFLKEIISIMRSIKISTVGPKPKAPWKPVQRGIIMTTHSVLEIAEFLLKEVGVMKFLPGRLVTDAIENLFSQVRQGNPKPNCLEFTNYLRIITISQFQHVPETSNYNIDDNEYLLNLLAPKPRTPSINGRADKNTLVHDAKSLPNSLSDWELVDTEKSIFHDMCGYYVNRASKRLKCKQCLDFMTYSCPTLPEHRLTQLKEYVYDENKLLYVKEDIITYLQKCEKIFTTEEPQFSNHTDIRSGLRELFLGIPHEFNTNCHDIKNQLASVFAQSRVGIYTKNRRKTRKISTKRKISYAMGTSGGKKQKLE